MPKPQSHPPPLSFRTRVSNVPRASLRGGSRRLASSLGAGDIAKPRDPNWIAIGKACRQYQLSTHLSHVVPERRQKHVAALLETRNAVLLDAELFRHVLLGQLTGLAQVAQ